MGVQYTKTLYHPHNFSVNLKLFQKIRFIFFKVTRRVRLVSVHLQARVGAPPVSAHANCPCRNPRGGQGPWVRGTPATAGWNQPTCKEKRWQGAETSEKIQNWEAGLWRFSARKPKWKWKHPEVSVEWWMKKVCMTQKSFKVTRKRIRCPHCKWVKNKSIYLYIYK